MVEDNKHRHMTPQSPRTLKTVERTIDVIEALEHFTEAGVSELADHLECSKGGIYNHLATLHGRGYVVKNGTKYRLSHRFFNLGHFVKHRTELYNIAKPELDRLAEATGGHAVLVIEEFGKAVYLYRAIGKRGVSEEFSARRLENTDYLHGSSVGKAILANLPLDQVETIVKRHGLPERTPNTITTVDELLEERVRIQERGYAVCDEEAVPGVRAVGAPIFNGEMKLLGAISVSGPKQRLGDELIYGPLQEMVRETANIIEVNSTTRDTTKLVRY